ncbi:hypothetical protein OESDEN_08772 [Oesophagostomum dentatum]|uniref:Uncharacterized protein n=1 Tax=Oesophagostomum dentatum TaxID=61180 RepID=A0A0B1T285_OESDE|nr:hypothetical protein OESDEN_08772 [Oesophagostomum dentatum]
MNDVAMRLSPKQYMYEDSLLLKKNMENIDDFSLEIVGDCIRAIHSDASFEFNKNFPVSSNEWANNEILVMAVGDGHVLWTDTSGSEVRVVTKVQLLCSKGPPEQIHVSSNFCKVR